MAVPLLFFLVIPARAPSGGKLGTGGRTIASLQEEDFDRRLLKLQLCYGVRMVADQCTIERRRVCKALLVHELETVLEGEGNYFPKPMEFHCEDSAVGKPFPAEDGTHFLRPNTELASIHQAIAANFFPGTQSTVQPRAHREAREACEFLTECKWAMRPQSLSLRKLASCIVGNNASRRMAFLQEAGAMVFGGTAGRREILYPRLLGD